jgi:trypsin
MGFGTFNEGGFDGSTYLQEVDINAVRHTTCNTQYDGEIVEEIMLCAGKSNIEAQLGSVRHLTHHVIKTWKTGVPGGGKDSCQGDSGGPIINADGTQVGIVSWVRRSK